MRNLGLAALVGGMVALPALGDCVRIDSAEYIVGTRVPGGPDVFDRNLSVTAPYTSFLESVSGTATAEAGATVTTLSGDRISAFGRVHTEKAGEAGQYQASQSLNIIFEVLRNNTTITFGGSMTSVITGGLSYVYTQMVVSDLSYTPLFSPDAGGGTPMAIARGWYLLDVSVTHLSQSPDDQSQTTDWDFDVRFDCPSTVPLPGSGALALAGVTLLTSRRRRP